MEHNVELHLYANCYLDGTFDVLRVLDFGPSTAMKNSVIKVDYDYRPWPVVGGNLLWQ